ncbi:HNH endonuclease [Mesorhizobium sp. VK4C]|uniref:HNH endonuclease n=1 Tax=Mesorhizobium captivum TaxID=3072319 RepID=UPI002A24076F|nr:HNH endonuclease [Mesorhizobium sp. VK4C]MDX8496899.1 HNH endonuclease [Mesorhizobium sp. VK4C]
MLALDLLYRHGKPIDRHHPDSIELSELLRAAPIYPEAQRKGSFRNSDGVALKLQNLLSAIDPNRGLSFSKTDTEVVAEFPISRKAELAKLAIAIREALSDASEIVIGDQEDIEFQEGKFLTARHRQRDRRLRKKLIEARRPGGLKCEICNFTVSPNASRSTDSFFEGHHTIPLAAAEGERTTRLSDMALLCACCHRFIHRLIADNRRWVGTTEAAAARKALLFESKGTATVV